MKKYSLLFAILLCSVLSYTAVTAEETTTKKNKVWFQVTDEGGDDIDASLEDATVTDEKDKKEDETSAVESDKEASDKSESVSDKAKEQLEEKDKDKDKEEDDDATGLATLPNGPAYIGVYSYVNLRDGVWGNIQAQMLNNEEVEITGRDGDWYKVNTGKGNGYIHARYVFAEKDKRYVGNEVNEWDNPNGYSGSNSPSGSSNTIAAKDVIINVDGDSVQGKVVNAAKQIHDKYQGYQAFPYDPLTEGGNLGCAQVATTVLKAAGVLNQINLSCNGTIGLLEQAGWSSVTWPPYQAGDVVFWETYLPGPSHVGIVMNSGNSAQAMNNSSSKRMPQYSDITSMKICKIMRKL